MNVCSLCCTFGIHDKYKVCLGLRWEEAWGGRALRGGEGGEKYTVCLGQKYTVCLGQRHAH